MAEEIKKENTEEAAPEAAETELAEKTDGKAKKKEKKLENEIEALKAELAKKEAEAKEQNEKYLRVVAEYDNFRKRSKAEREGVYADACADVIGALLPVYDNIERAAAFTDADAEKLAEGVRLTAKSFTDALEKLGVTEIEAKTFDPSLHNAVMHVEDETKGDGEIVEVFQKGYKKGDKVIRYAMVKSAN
mgnify:FL=1